MVFFKALFITLETWARPFYARDNLKIVNNIILRMNFKIVTAVMLLLLPFAQAKIDGYASALKYHDDSKCMNGKRIL